MSSFDGATLIDAARETFNAAEQLSGFNRIGLLIGASNQAPVRTFIQTLLGVYQQLHDNERDFEVVYVSFDRTEEEFFAALQGVPWFAIQFASPALRKFQQLYAAELKELPALIVVDEKGAVITSNGREFVESKGWKSFDKWATMKPETKRPVSAAASNSLLSKSKRLKPRRVVSPARVHESQANIEQEDELERQEDPSISRFVWRNYMQGNEVVERPRSNVGFANRSSGSLAPIHVAARDGSVQLLRYIAQRETDYRTKDERDRTCVHYAAMHGGGKSPRALYKQLRTWIAGPPVQTEDGVAYPNKGRWVDLLLDVDHEGNTALHFACRYGHAVFGSLLLEDAPEAVEMQNNSGRRPFDDMLFYGHAGMFGEGTVLSELIIPVSTKANLAMRDTADGDAADTAWSAKYIKRCNRALLAAVLANDVELVRYLLETTPANPAASSKGVSILDHAVRQGNMSIVKILDNQANPQGIVNIELFPWEKADIKRIETPQRKVRA